MTELIRAAQEEDAAALRALRLQLFRESDTMLWEPDEYTATIAHERRRIIDLTSAANCLCLVAAVEKQLVGLCFAIGGRMNRLRHSATLVLGVVQAYENRGIGTNLVLEAVKWSEQSRIKRLDLTVHVGHRKAVGIYQKCGFVVEGTRRASLLVNGSYVDEYLMSRITDDSAKADVSL